MEELKNINSLKDIVNYRFDLYKDKEAFIQKNVETQEYEHITYSNVKAEINGLGTYMLKKLKIKGEKVAIIGDNSYEWYVTLMAVICGVGMAVPLDKNLSAEEIISLIQETEIKVIVYSSYIKDSIEKIRTKVKGCIFIQIDKKEEDSYSLNWKIIVEEGIELVNNDERIYIDSKVDRDEYVILRYTSGIQYNSNGVMLSHKNLCSNIYSYSCLLPNFSDYTSFSVLPIHYGFEFTLNYLFMTAIGARIGITNNIEEIQQDIKIIKPDYMLVSKAILKKINEIINRVIKENVKDKNKILISIIRSLRKIGINTKNSVYTKIQEVFGGNLKFISCIASNIDSNVIKNIEKFDISFLQCYGVIESCSIVASTRLKNNISGTVGKAVEGVDIRIDLSKNDSENSNIGEIMVSGDNVIHGYYKDEELTKKTIKNGWIYTGDLGYFNLSGELIIVGKKANLIIDQNKKKIYPEELEGFINNLPLIKDSMVYNKNYSKKTDEVKLVARVELDQEDLNRVYKENLPTDEVIFKVIVDEIRKINRMMASYKAIKEVEIKKNPFIRNASMQILREEELKNTTNEFIITKESITQKKSKKRIIIKKK